MVGSDVTQYRTTHGAFPTAQASFKNGRSDLEVIRFGIPRHYAIIPGWKSAAQSRLHADVCLDVRAEEVQCIGKYKKEGREQKGWNATSGLIL